MSTLVRGACLNSDGRDDGNGSSCHNGDSSSEPGTDSDVDDKDHYAEFAFSVPYLCCSASFMKICGVACALSCVMLLVFGAVVENIDWRLWNGIIVSSDACPIAYDPSYMAPMTQAVRAAFCQGDQADAMVSWECEPCKKSGLQIDHGTYRAVHGSFLAENSTYAYVVRLSDVQSANLSFQPYKSACLMAFRGSLNVYNVIEDADARPCYLGSKYKCPKCLAHCGFFNAWQSMEDIAVATLNELKCSSIIVTGHSLGSAIATLATWTLTQVYGFELRMFYSFESPRVGDPAFHYYFNRNISSLTPSFRFTYYNDAVVQLPPVAANFEHVNCEIYYDQEGKFTVCHHDEDPTCSAKWTLLQADYDWSGIGSGAHCHPSYAPDICNC